MYKYTNLGKRGIKYINVMYLQFGLLHVKLNIGQL